MRSLLRSALVCACGGRVIDNRLPASSPVPAHDAGAMQHRTDGTTSTAPPPSATPSDALPLRDYTLGGLTSDGRVVAAYSDGAAENVAMLDPKTGAPTLVGNLGSLQQWEGKFIYDDHTHLAYALGGNGAGRSPGHDIAALWPLTAHQ